MFESANDASLAYDIIAKARETGPAILRHAARLPDAERASFLVNAAQHLVPYHEQAAAYDRLPVDVQTFVESNEFLACGEAIYPSVMEVLRDINSGQYTEAVLTGAIGTGKTTIALLTTAYQLHVLSCLRDPHAFFRLDPASEIVFAIQSLSARVAKDVAYQRLREMVDKSPYFQRHFCPSARIRNELVFPGRITVRPLSSRATAAIGSNVIGGILDEVNYFDTVERSKRSPDGGEYDQALEAYNSLARRRKSRFMSHGGKLPGILCLVSSKRFPGEFTDQKQIEAQREITDTGRTSIYVYDRRLWQIKPPGTYGNARFRLFLGDSTRKPCILEAEARVAEEDERLVMAVPEEFRSEFQRDMLSAIRDIAGSATFALHPFILNTEAVTAAFGRRSSVLSTPTTDFKSSRPAIYGGRPFGRGALYHLLQNRVYLGMIVHKGVPHPGQHPAIVPQDLWGRAQEILSTNRVVRRRARTEGSAHMLVGKLRDEHGRPMAPVSTHKANGQRYRYYVSDGLVSGAKVAAGPVARIPADAIEQLVAAQCSERCGASWATMSPTQRKQQVRAAVDRVVVRRSEVEIGFATGDVITLPVRLALRARGKTITPLESRHAKGGTPDRALVRAIARTSRWRELLESGEARTPYDLARLEQCRVSYVQRHLRLAFLSPRLIEAILEGRQPAWCVLSELLDQAEQLSWVCRPSVQ